MRPPPSADPHGCVQNGRHPHLLQNNEIHCAAVTCNAVYRVYGIFNPHPLQNPKLPVKFKSLENDTLLRKQKDWWE